MLGRALARREPDERTDAARRWKGVEIAAAYSGTWLADPAPRTIVVDAEVLHLEDGSFHLSLAAAPSAQGARVDVATGTQQGDTVTLDWDLDALGGVFGVQGAPGPLAATWTLDVDGVRTVEGRVGAGAEEAGFTVTGDVGLVFDADLAVTDDGLPWPATVEAEQLPGEGGRASGVVHRGTEDLVFEACWDAAGHPVYAGGDPGVGTTGDAGGCVAP